MARPQKLGLDYWNIDTNVESNSKIRLLMMQFGFTGLGIWTHFHNLIYANGYYIPIDDESIEMSALSGSCEITKLHEIIEYMLNKNIFDREILEKYKILTSKEIQKRFLAIVYRRKRIPIIPEIWLCNYPDPEDPKTGKQNLKLLQLIVHIDLNGDIVNYNPFNVRNNSVNNNNNEQRSIEDRRQ